MDRKILSFNDIVIRQSDLDCLRPRQWLNDVVIEFYLQYLSSDAPAESRDILYVPPSTTYLMLHGGLELARSVADSLHVGEYSTLFFALNNSTNPGSLYGGTHWSSLVVDVAHEKCMHYDSSIGINDEPAKAFASVLSTILACTFRFEQVINFPQQNNSYDCGLYCICVAVAYAPDEVYLNKKPHIDHLLPDDKTRESPLHKIQVMHTRLPSFRDYLTQLIQKLASNVCPSH